MSAPPGEGCTTSRKQLHRAWLQLVRAPNLFTAVGDPVAGACLVAAAGTTLAGGPVVIAAISAVAVYAAGMVDNDLVDLETDRSERPQRPLPAGAVSLRQARKGRFILLLVPYLFALVYRMPAPWVATHMSLLFACLAYNRLKARSMAVGTLLMGLCRVLSLASGFVVVAHPEGRVLTLWLVAALLAWWGYIGGISLFAVHETTRVPGPVRYVLVLPPVLLVVGGLLPSVPPAAAFAMKAAGAMGALCVMDVMWRLGRDSTPRDVPPAVGRLVRVLLPMQAVLCLATPVGAVPCLLLLLCWVMAECVGRRFYAS